LNLQPLLLEQLDESYDVVLCVNGIQYLTQVETVVAEVRGTASTWVDTARLVQHCCDSIAL
jgi:hypothetical protein